MVRRGSPATALLSRASPSGPSSAASTELDPSRPNVERATLAAVELDGDARLLLTRVGGVAVERGIELLVRPAAEDQRRVGASCGVERALAAGGHREQRGESRHHAREADDDDQGRGPALGNAPDVDAGDGESLTQHDGIS